MNLFEEVPLKTHVQEMRRMAVRLIPHTYPLVNTKENEDSEFFRKRIIFVDGYEITVHFSISEIKPDHVLLTLQIFSRQFTFLPMRVVCKVAKAFLGKEHLSFDEVMLTDNYFNRNIYIWSVHYKDRKPIQNALAEKKVEFEGFSFDKIKVKYF